MRVYKFLTSQWAKDALFKRHLKVSLLSALNDPYDGNCLKFSDLRHQDSWKKVARQIGQQYGLICFSKTWNDPVHWSHYADQHKGIALGFDVSNEYLLPVSYRDSLLEFDDFLCLDKEEQKKRFILSAFSTKYTAWRSEDEVRLFVSLMEPDHAAGHFFKTFDKDLVIREVIFGSRFEAPELEALMLSRCRALGNVVCMRARLGTAGFQLEVDDRWSF